MKTLMFMHAVLTACCHAYASSPDDLKTNVLEGFRKISNVKDYRVYNHFSKLLSYEVGGKRDSILIPNKYSDVNGKSTSIYFKKNELSNYAPVIPWVNLIVFKDASTKVERAVLNLQISTESFCLTQSDFMSVFQSATVEQNTDGTLLTLSYKVPGKKHRTVSSLFSGDCAINFIATQIL